MITVQAREDTRVEIEGNVLEEENSFEYLGRELEFVLERLEQFAQKSKMYGTVGEYRSILRYDCTTVQ